MLSPRQSATRERTSLDGLWRFALDPEGTGRADGWWTSALPSDGEMAVPASFNDIVPTREVRNHVGDVWYQRTVRVPRGWDGQRIVLRFDAATHRATAWVGDAQVVEHEGGYTPFGADVTEHVRPGDEARLSVVVNNELSWTSIPPGFVQLDDGRRVQQYFHDFFNDRWSREADSSRIAQRPRSDTIRALGMSCPPPMSGGYPPRREPTRRRACRGWPVNSARSEDDVLQRPPTCSTSADVTSPTVGTVAAARARASRSGG